jgi:hypothetical protein
MTTLKNGASYEGFLAHLRALFAQAMNATTDADDLVPVLINGGSLTSLQLVRREDGSLAINLTSE